MIYNVGKEANETAKNCANITIAHLNTGASDSDCIDCADCDGITPLMEAIIHNAIDVVEVGKNFIMLKLYFESLVVF